MDSRYKRKHHQRNVKNYTKNEGGDISMIKYCYVI